MFTKQTQWKRILSVLIFFVASFLFLAQCSNAPKGVDNQSRLLGGPTEGTITHGGFGAECKQADGSTTIELLDYVEAKHRWQFDIFTGDDSLDEMAQVNFVLDRLEKIDPDRAGRYHEALKTFMDNTAFVPNSALGPLQDAGFVVIPDDCKLIQVAVRKVPELPDEKTFNISKNLWDKMSYQSRAGLILHEIIYLEIEGGSSAKSRYYNSYISSRKMENPDRKEYVDTLKQCDLSALLTFEGVVFELEGVEFYDNGNVKKGTTVTSSWSKTNSSGNQISLHIDTHNDTAEFFENGNLKFASGHIDIKFTDNNVNFESISPDFCSEVHFSSDGNLLSCVGNYIELTTQNKYRTIEFLPVKESENESKIEFFTSGMFKSAVAAHSDKTFVKDSEGTFWKCDFLSRRIIFNEQGALLPQESEHCKKINFGEPDYPYDECKLERAETSGTAVVFPTPHIFLGGACHIDKRYDSFYIIRSDQDANNPTYWFGASYPGGPSFDHGDGYKLQNISVSDNDGTFTFSSDDGKCGYVKLKITGKNVEMKVKHHGIWNGYWFDSSDPASVDVDQGETIQCNLIDSNGHSI